MDSSSGFHALKFKDGVLILSDSRLLLLAVKLDLLESNIADTAAAFERAALERAGFKWLRKVVPFVVQDLEPPDPCAWNLLFRRRRVC